MDNKIAPEPSTPLSIDAIEQEIAAEFSALPQNSNAKWQWLLSLARENLPVEKELPDEKFLVKGCATRLYLLPRFDGKKLWLEIDVDRSGDSPFFSFGLAVLARRLYSGQTPTAVLESDPLFFKRAGIIEQLSPQRSNGFASLLKLIRLYAAVYSKMEKK